MTRIACSQGVLPIACCAAAAAECKEQEVSCKPVCMVSWRLQHLFERQHQLVWPNLVSPLSAPDLSILHVKLLHNHAFPITWLSQSAEQPHDMHLFIQFV